MKSCTKCGETKEFDLFKKNSKMVDGYDSWCKSCHNRLKQIWLNNHPEKRRERDKRRYAQLMRRKRGDNYVVGSSENRRGNRAVVLDSETKRLRHNARRIARRAIASGKLIKHPCQICGEAQVESHHPDYSQPLDVVWLCKDHHAEIHK